jgi:hypothetical protein
MEFCPLLLLVTSVCQLTQSVFMTDAAAVPGSVFQGPKINTHSNSHEQTDQCDIITRTTEEQKGKKKKKSLLASRIYYQIETISMADVCHFSLF